MNAKTSTTKKQKTKKRSNQMTKSQYISQWKNIEYDTEYIEFCKTMDFAVSNNYENVMLTLLKDANYDYIQIYIAKMPENELKTRIKQLDYDINFLRRQQANEQSSEDEELSISDESNDTVIINDNTNEVIIGTETLDSESKELVKPKAKQNRLKMPNKFDLWWNDILTDKITIYDRHSSFDCTFAIVETLAGLYICNKKQVVLGKVRDWVDRNNEVPDCFKSKDNEVLDPYTNDIIQEYIIYKNNSIYHSLYPGTYRSYRYNKITEELAKTNMIE